MSYTLNFSLALGPGKAGLTDLRAQLVTSSGTNSGTAISTGFAEIGSGNYIWNYASFADDFRGGVKFYSNAAASTVLAFAAINPEEAEYSDAKVSTRLSTASYSAPPSVSAIRSEIDANSTKLDATVSSRLASAGYTAPDNSTIASIASAVAALPSASTIASAVWASGSRTLTSFGTLVADIWSYATRTLTTGGGVTAAQIWDYLTSSATTSGSIGKMLVDRVDAAISSIAATVAASNPASVSGGTLYMRRAVTYDGTITGLSLIPASWTLALFTMKTKEEALETDAVIQIQVSNPSSGSDGLLLLNGATSTLNYASLSINQGAGTATIHIEDAAMASITPNDYVYDLKFFYGTSDSVSTVPATATVSKVVTLTV